MSISEAKRALDSVIEKSRVHLYKPIQIAEILYRDRTFGDIALGDVETYRTASKGWRNVISEKFLGRTCTSSCRFQDNLFEDNAVPPKILEVLGKENRAKHGIVEAYIYRRLESKHAQMVAGLDYCFSSDKNSFKINDFINLFWLEPGLKRSIDKIYEIVVYAIFCTIVGELEATITVTINPDKISVLKNFEGFSEKILCINEKSLSYTGPARLFRVGVTNAADRGLDMWANWGPAIQIKHLALDEALAENVVSSVASDRIIIVCKSAEKNIIYSLINQLGLKSRIQSIVTEDELVSWYETALRGAYAQSMGDNLLNTIREEIQREFPSSVKGKFSDFYAERDYASLNDDLWVC